MCTRLLFAHGAGAGKDSPFMLQMTGLLQQQGIEVELFDFPYMQQMALTGKRRPPDRFERLVEAMAQQLDKLPTDLPLVLAGKSMGGRVAVALAAERNLPALVFGYPFHPLGKPERLRLELLAAMPREVLILQGERDSFGTRAEVESYGLGEQVRLEWLPDGDHSLKPRKRSGHTLQANMALAATRCKQWIDKQ